MDSQGGNANHLKIIFLELKAETVEENFRWASAYLSRT